MPLLTISALSLAIIGLYLFIEYDNRSRGVISVSIGMPIADVENRLTVPVTFTNSSNAGGYAEYHDDIRHDLKVVSGKVVFVLPNMNSVAMQAIDGRLRHVDDRPSASLMSLDDVLRWTENTSSLVDKSGWKRDPDSRMRLYSGELGVSFSSTSELRKAFFDQDLAIRLKRVRVATWRRGNELVNLEIARIPYFDPPKRHLTEDQVYFATIYIGLDQTGSTLEQ